jgi:tRNA U34 2-thiouridine synthase MnmA/TrmU
VTSVDVAAGTVNVGPAEQLLDERTAVEGFAWVATPVAGTVRVQTSAHGAAAIARVARGIDDASVELVWAEPHRRVARGQTVVVYDADDRVVLAGGLAR